MTEKRYDTRRRTEILAAEHFAPYRDLAGMAEIKQRELRTLDAFFQWAKRQNVTVPTVDDFLSFVSGDTSPRRLENLRAAFDRLFPEETPVRQTIRAAIRMKKPRGRVCDRRSREALLAEPHLAPYAALPQISDVTLEDLRVLERFLAFASVRRIGVPNVADYLEFSSDVSSSRRLRSLQTALGILLPGNPGVEIVLAEAIAWKSPERLSRKGQKPRPLAERRVSRVALPDSWREILDAMRAGLDTNGRPPPAASRIDSMEDVLREYARVQEDAEEPMTITIEGLRRLERVRSTHATARKEPAYALQGNRPATQHTVVMRLRQFAQHLGVDPLTLDALKEHERNLRNALGSVVPLKFGKYDNLPGLSELWKIAKNLLKKSAEASHRATKHRLLNDAVILAFWTLIPLRLQDGGLTWGMELHFDGDRYCIDVETHKEDEPLRGRLHPALTPFLDALILRGVDPAYLDEMRTRAISGRLPVFSDITGRMLARSFPSKVWGRHLGTGAHIARTQVHTELGRLGPEGVTAALALNAQGDARSAAFYTHASALRAMQERGQGMIDSLLDAAANEECQAAKA